MCVDHYLKTEAKLMSDNYQTYMVLGGAVLEINPDEGFKEWPPFFSVDDMPQIQYAPLPNKPAESNH